MANIIYPDKSYQLMKILFEVQNKLGTKYQEKHYQRAVATKLSLNKISYKKEFKINMQFENRKLADFYADFLLWDLIILELKTVNYMHPDYSRQILRYLITANKKLGILVNFRVKPLEYKRIINPQYKD